MSTIHDAKKILSDAEAALRQLIEQGLKNQRYAEIAEIATLAEGVAGLLRGPEQPSGSLGPKPGREPSARRRSSKARGSGNPAARDYPKFQRDGAKLVKVGWSKKNKSEYEHRVTEEIVAEIVRHLTSHVAVNEVFAVDDVLPVTDTGGSEVPSYQVYLVLAWLKKVGSVEKKGRDGYVILNDGLRSGGLQVLWNELPERAQ